MSTSLVFLPGSGADPEFWRPVGNLLPQEWSKAYLRWPGIGHNPPEPGVNGFEDLVSLAERQLPANGATIVAQSLGGAIALRLALLHPQRVCSLVLCASAAGLDVHGLSAADWRPTYRQEYPNAASWIYEARAHVDAELPNVVQPTLLIWGDNDPISPVGVGQRLNRLIPNSRLHVLAGGTHALGFERAQEVASLVCSHVLKVEA